MKSRRNVALSGAVVIFLLFLSDVGRVGGDALKDESGEDDLKTPLPLVVAIPSKVFRANRLSANDVIGVMPTLDTEKVEFTHFVTTRRPFSTTVTTEESTIASSTTTTTTTTPSPTSELTTPSTTITSTTEFTAPTTEKVTISNNVTKEIEANNSVTDVGSIESRNEPILLEINSTLTVNETKDSEITTRTTTELTTPSTTTSSTTTSTTTTESSANEEVAEKDYGQSLGFDPEPDLDEHPTFSSDSQDDGMSVVAVTNESEIEETTSDEIDPFDVAAQASEVDYAVIASDDHRGVSRTNQEMVKNETALYRNEDEDESLEERDEDHSNVTLSHVDIAEKQNETDEFETDKKQSFVSTNALYNLNKKFLSKDDPQKDLVAAASAVGSPTVVGPDAQMDDLTGPSYDDIVPTAEASAPVLQEAAPTAPADPEYEYIYEYVDLNTTDIPTDLPEGVVILTGDQRLPLASTAKPVEVSTEPHLTTVDDHSPVRAAKSNDSITEEQPLPHDYEEFHPLSGDTKSFTSDDTKSFTSDDTKSFTSDDPKSFTSDDFKSFTNDDLKSFTNSEFVTEPATAAVDPFVPNFPQSPVYFVGLQRETLPPSDGSSAPDSFVSSPDTFVSAQTTTTEPPKSVRRPAGDSQSDPDVQLNTLYALSRALPINDNVPFLIEDGDLENTTILLPPDLPDPFSDELLGTSIGLPQSTTEEFFATATTELPTTSTEPSTTTTPTTTTEEPTTTTTTEATTTTTEEPITSATRATRPGVRRRPTTSAAPEGSSVEQATTAASGTRQRGQRIGGRRRPTTSTAAPSAGANGGITNFTLTEKTRTGQRNRRPISSRTRTTTAGSNIDEASNDSASDKSGATNDNSISGTNGVKRPGSSRRTFVRPSANGSGGANATESAESGGTIPQRPTRARRPALNKSGSKLNKETGNGKASSSESSTEKKGEEAATRKPLFRPRNRNRFNLRNKAEAAAPSTTTTTEHHPPSDEVPLTTAEHAEGESTGEEASAAPAEDGEKVVVTEAPAPSGEHSRKFPPRTRPGARATLRHSQS